MITEGIVCYNFTIYFWGVRCSDYVN